jgi:hypothetical protein
MNFAIVQPKECNQCILRFLGTPMNEYYITLVFHTPP